MNMTATRYQVLWTEDGDTIYPDIADGDRVTCEQRDGQQYPIIVERPLPEITDMVPGTLFWGFDAAQKKWRRLSRTGGNSREGLVDTMTGSNFPASRIDATRGFLDIVVPAEVPLEGE